MDNDISSQPLTTFTHFPQLPSELRLKIWGHILHHPRLIRVIASQSHWRNPYATSGWTAPDTAIPVALHICHESRQEALKSYQLAFGSPFADARIYIDFSIDTIRFGNGPGIENTRDLGSRGIDPSDYKLDIFLGGGPHGAESYEKVENMILDFHEDIYDRRDHCWNEIRLFTNLKYLTLLVWEPDFVMSQMIPQYKGILGRVMGAHPEWVVPQIGIISMESGTDWGLLEVPVLEEAAESRE